MTLDEFLEELKKTRGPWHIEANGEIRCARGACPINAVMYERDRNHENLEAVGYAADLLGLQSGTVDKIVRAADNRRSKKVRALILAGLGLAEGR